MSIKTNKHAGQIKIQKQALYRYYWKWYNTEQPALCVATGTEKSIAGFVSKLYKALRQGETVEVLWLEKNPNTGEQTEVFRLTVQQDIFSVPSGTWKSQVAHALKTRTPMPSMGIKPSYSAHTRNISY